MISHNIYFKTFFLLFLFSNQILGQVISVKQKHTNQTLELVSISNQNLQIQVITNKLGQANISKFKGVQKIEIRLVGYQKQILSFEEIEKQNFIIFLEEDDFSLEQIVVSANKSVQISRQVPVKISKIAEKEITLQNPQTTADLLAISGEVFIQKSQQGGGSPMIRGFSTNRLLYSVDGVRMNTAIFRSGNLQNVISLDPFALESTEIFFGAGSVIYGSDAIGAVMSFQTLSPQLSENENLFTKGKALFRYSSANQEQTAHFDINLGWKNWASTTSFSSFNFGDLQMGQNGTDDYLHTFYVQRQNKQDIIIQNDDPLVQNSTGYNQINLMQKIRFQPNPNWNFQYDFHYSETSDYGRYDRLIQTRGKLPRSAEWFYGPQVWMMNHVQVSHSKSNFFYDNLTMHLAQQFFKESRNDRNFQNENLRTRTEKVNAYSINLDFNKKITEKQSLFYGVEWVQNWVNSEGLNKNINTNQVSIIASRYPNSLWSSSALYFSYQNELSETLNFSMGFRFNHYDLKSDFDTDFFPFPFREANLSKNAMTGNLGLVVNPDEMTSLSLNFSTGFRSPNVDDMGKIFDSEPGAVIIPNPNLQAEYAYNMEVGFAKILGENLKVDANFYYTILENAMTRRNFTLNGQDSIVYDGVLSQVQAIQNAALSKIYGLQAGAEIRFEQGLNIWTRWNLQIGKEELDDGTISPARHAAPLFGTLHFTFLKENFSLDVYGIYNAEVSFSRLPFGEQSKEHIYAKDGAGNPYSPSWFTLNFKGNYQIDKTFLVGVGLENITDQRYRPYSSGLVSAGRNFVISLRAEF